MPLLDILRKEYREQVLEIAKSYGGSNVKVFGSVARGEEDENSDIDLLMDIEKDRSLLDIVRLKRALETLLQHKVDIVESASIKDNIREFILADAKML
jgi:predicted nucleotidyltransferase